MIREALEQFLDSAHGARPRMIGVVSVPELVSRYADLPLGFSDAAVAACAERRRAKVLTLDRRDFDVLAGEGALQIVP